MPEFKDEPGLFKRMKSLVGLGPKDINLPDEMAGKPVRRTGGGLTKGGSPDDARWIDFNKRKGEQALKTITDFAEKMKPQRRKPK